MSQWTHVAGIIRLDSLGIALVKGPEDEKHQKILAAIEKAMGGKPTNFDGPRGACNLPLGSEGSLQYSILRNRDNEDGHSLSWGYVSIWGDLRDYGAEDVPRIEKWLKETAARLLKPEGFGAPESMSMPEKMEYMLSAFGIRDLVLMVRVEYGASILLLWDDDKREVISQELAPAAA